MNGVIEIVKKHERPIRHGPAVGLDWGLAAGVVAVPFPPVGIFGALAIGSGGRVAIDAVAAAARHQCGQPRHFKSHCHGGGPDCR